jgi:hypothetical protein
MINNILPLRFLNATAQEASKYEVGIGWSRDIESNPHTYDSNVMHPHIDRSIQNRPNFPHIDQGHFKTIYLWDLGL